MENKRQSSWFIAILGTATVMVALWMNNPITGLPITQAGSKMWICHYVSSWQEYVRIEISRNAWGAHKRLHGDVKAPQPDSCEGLSNDCTGAGEPCSEGTGACEAFGVQVCRPDGKGTYCDAVPGDPSPEMCNDIDDDCDGQVDEDFPSLGQACVVGVGECRNAGTRICSADGTGTECNVSPGNPTPELCDGLDNDCDGLIDENFPTLGDACSVGVGACANSGPIICRDDGKGTQCDAEPGDPVPEIDCNGIDDDCDGLIDEGSPPICTCTTRLEVCNGLDDDCDGEIDEGGVCG